MSAFVDGLNHSTGVPNAKGASKVITDLNASLEKLKTSDPKEILDKTQTNFEAILK